MTLSARLGDAQSSLGDVFGRWAPLSPDAYTLSALLACHPPAAAVQQLWVSLVDDGVVRADAVAWTARINALAAAGDATAALAAWRAMIAAAEAAEAPAEAAALTPTAATFRCVAEALAQLPLDVARGPAEQLLERCLATVPPHELTTELCDAFVVLLSETAVAALLSAVEGAAAAASTLTALAACPAVGACRHVAGTADTAAVPLDRYACAWGPMMHQTREGRDILRSV